MKSDKGGRAIGVPLGAVALAVAELHEEALQRLGVAVYLTDDVVGHCGSVNRRRW